MKARIDGFQYGDGVLIALVGFYYTADEDGYEPPKGQRRLGNLFRWEELEQEPFITLPFPTDYVRGLEDLKVSIRGQLNAFKAAHTKLPEYAEWLGYEFEASGNDRT